MMRIAAISTSISRRAGGLEPVLWGLAAEYAGRGHRVELLALEDEDEIRPCDGEVCFRTFKKWGPARFGYSPSLARVLRSLEADVFHVHGLWTYPGLAAAGVAAKKGTPLVVSPHGMLKQWALGSGGRRKRMAAWLYERRNLTSATCLHATAEDEAQGFRDYGLTNPIAVVPNGVDVTECCREQARSAVNRRWPHLREKKLILFLSRIHPVKGLHNLAQAWGAVQSGRGRWHLVVAGPDWEGHQAPFRRAIEQVGAEQDTTFVGPVYGQAKSILYAGCDLFVLPTLSENFASVVAEALAVGTPVITTHAAPWRELQTDRCGWWIPVGVEPLEAALREAIELPAEVKVEMGRRGKELVQRRYTWPRVAEQLLDVYQWLLDCAPQPEWVRLH